MLMNESLKHFVIISGFSEGILTLPDLIRSAA